MIRLQRVTFLALHDYLGLTTELTRSNDDISQVQTTHHSQHNNHSRRTRTHPDTISHIAKPSIDTSNNPEDDLIDNDTFRPTGSISTMPYTSPSSDQTPTTMTPDITNNTNQFEHPKTPTITERTISIPKTAQKRAATNFAGQRSMSVVDSHRSKPDFEEAAARARVKNSIDTTFFQKHKISYPNVLNNRLINSSSTKQRSSFSDVNSYFAFFFSSLILFFFKFY
jgi:hypothetical protein